MAAHLRWTLHGVIALSLCSFVTVNADAQQSPWPAYGAAAGRIVIRPRVQHIRWRPAHSLAVYGTAVVPAGIFTVGVGTTPAPAATNTGTGVAGTFTDLSNRNLRSRDLAPRTCERAMPRACAPEEPAASRDLRPPTPEPKALEAPAQRDFPAQKSTPAQKSGAEQKASPAQKAGNLNLRLHKLLANSESLLQELQEGADSEVYVARSAIEQR